MAAKSRGELAHINSTLSRILALYRKAYTLSTSSEEIDEKADINTDEMEETMGTLLENVDRSFKRVLEKVDEKLLSTLESEFVVADDFVEFEPFNESDEEGVFDPSEEEEDEEDSFPESSEEEDEDE